MVSAASVASTEVGVAATRRRRGGGGGTPRGAPVQARDQGAEPLRAAAARRLRCTALNLLHCAVSVPAKMLRFLYEAGYQSHRLPRVEPNQISISSRYSSRSVCLSSCDHDRCCDSLSFWFPWSAFLEGVLINNVYRAGRLTLDFPEFQSG